MFLRVTATCRNFPGPAISFANYAFEFLHSGFELREFAICVLESANNLLSCVLCFCIETKSAGCFIL